MKSAYYLLYDFTTLETNRMANDIYNEYDITSNL
jgi:hypothetical protein